MSELTVSQARENLAELIDSTQRSGEPVVLTRHGRPVAVVLDHALFERLVAAADDTSDRQALALGPGGRRHGAVGAGEGRSRAALRSAGP